jgi:hypothetical protein
MTRKQTARSPLAATRRGFLALAGAGAALGAVSGLRPVPAAAATPGEPVGFFEPPEREILTLVVERMVASDDPGEPRVRSTATIQTIEGVCAGLDPSLTAPLPWLLRLVEWGPLVFEARPSRFSALPGADRDVSLRGWMTSRFALRRQGFLALRNLAFLGYYTQPETWPGIGYRGPLLPPTPKGSAGSAGSA